MTQNPTFNPGPVSPSATAAPATVGKRPSTVVLAGAGSVLAVLAFLGGMAVGHSWDGTSTQQNQFGGPGGGQFPGQRGTGQNGTGQNGFGQGQGSNGQQGTVPGQG
ncbi:hypothetical protein AB0L70_00430 [Kribbella sp. NPDC051952]|uniref:hypothetical protein n=1 Tax=Kribbella sp. NPDC051952 TaxID=3154851 RepID=UPI003435CE40